MTRPHKKSPITDEEIRALWAYLDSPEADSRVRVIIGLMYFQGLRRVEVGRLRIEDFNPDAKTLLVWGKGRDDKEVVDCHPKMVAILRDYLARTRLKSGALFPSRKKGNGESLSSNMIYRLVTRQRIGVTVDAREAVRGLVDRLPAVQFRAAFAYPPPEGVTYVSRTHPVTEAVAAHVVDGAIDPLVDGPARRCGAIRSRAVAVRTTLLVVRHRFEIKERRGDQVRAEIADECRLLAFRGAPEQAAWLDDPGAQALLTTSPDANVAPEQATEFVRRVVGSLDCLTDHLVADAQARAAKLLESHQRARTAARITGHSCTVEPHLPVDVLGIYVFLPEGE